MGVSQWVWSSFCPPCRSTASPMHAALTLSSACPTAQRVKNGDLLCVLMSTLTWYSLLTDKGHKVSDERVQNPSGKTMASDKEGRTLRDAGYHSPRALRKKLGEEDKRAEIREVSSGTRSASPRKQTYNSGDTHHSPQTSKANGIQAPPLRAPVCILGGFPNEPSRIPKKKRYSFL